MTGPARVRWRPGACGDNILGYVGTLPSWAFQIFSSGDPAEGRKMIAQLPGMSGLVARDPDPEVLKGEAEDWLVGYVASVGAVFPEPTTTAEPDRVTVMLLHDPDSGAVVDLTVYEDGLKAAGDAQQTSDDSGYTVQIWTDRPYISGTLATGKEG